LEFKLQIWYHFFEIDYLIFKFYAFSSKKKKKFKTFEKCLFENEKKKKIERHVDLEFRNEIEFYF